jgi:7-cyano-7-deazaguanine synthase in queuosine biosynthesis
MSTVLVMLSGGVDSTYLLYHYLTQTTNNVHVHHISIQYPQLSRWKMEKKAVDNVVDYARHHYRDFDFSSSSFSIDMGRNFGMDSDLQLLVASKVVPNLPGSSIKLALGWCSEDLQNTIVADRMKRNVTSNLWHALHDSILDNQHIARDLDMPLLDKSKKDLLQTIPKELLVLCWSCRNEEENQGGYIPCGRCHACRLNQQALGSTELDEKDFPNLIRDQTLKAESLVVEPAMPKVQEVPDSSVAGTLQYRVVARMDGALPNGNIANAPIFSLYPPPIEFQLTEHSDLTPFRTDIPLNGQLAFLIDNVLTPDEADMLITMSEQLGYDRATPGIHNLPGVRVNKALHWISDDTFLGAVFRRIKHLIPPELDGCRLHDMLSQRVNMYKYDKNDAFNKHLDGHWPGYGLNDNGQAIIEWPGTITKMTLLIYLNGPEDGVQGGLTTLFCPSGKTIEVAPKKGNAICFCHGPGDDSVVHEGSTVFGEVAKYVAKVNVVYESS